MTRRKAFVIDEQVWKILNDSKLPIGAYQIANMLPKVAATQVYRVLERFVSTGKAKRIVARNAFVAASPKTDLIVICGKCGEFELIECPDTILELAELCDKQSFDISEIFLETTGTCRECREQRET
ncbi:MAG: hypothetical protein ABJF89_10735 [Parasphingorhabdus sp.]|uniref:hypothetical protein n=1 Tax=Parasphingorhabdus sp. TaxID=2709688 RepID=UPI003263F468